MLSAAPSRHSRRRLAWLAAAPLLGLLLYWRVPATWFLNDDYGWVVLTRDLHEHGLAHALFAPFAQGTVRVLDRVHFLALTGLFGPQLLAYRLCGFLTWILALTLILLVGERLAGSRAAGALAAILWAASANSVAALVLVSAYYQLLCAALLLGALYARLTGRNVLEWICYLASFGVMEIAPMYAAVALICALAADRKGIRSALWMFAPAALFTTAHFFFVPKSASGPYKLALDSRLPSTIATYFGWTFEPGSSALRSHAAEYQAPELLLGMILGLTLTWFFVRCLMRREWAVTVFAGWFALLLAPMLLLPDHVTPYYLTIPSIGLAWLGGFAMVRAWRGSTPARIAAVALPAVYLIVSAGGIQAQTHWFQQRAGRMHAVVNGVAAEAAAYPGIPIVLEGVDDDLYQSGFESHPFLVAGVERVFRTPEDISEAGLRAAVAQGQARVLQIRGSTTTDVTDRFRP